MVETTTKPGKVAMVGTPCHMIAAAKLEKSSDILGETPIDIKIGLFCMENFSYSYMKKLLEENNIDINNVKECRIEKNFLWFYLEEEKLFKIPIEKAKSCIRKNCNICMDFTSELSDVSIGSVGSEKGWSTIIIRTDKGLELVRNAEQHKYIKTKAIEESGIQIIKKLANKKKKENLEEITKRERVGRPVIYRRQMPPEKYIEEVLKCQFQDLKGDVIDIGACVLCGACNYVCPEEIIQIQDRKPQLNGKCPEGCNLCYVACPRTYIPDDILSKKADKKPLVDYIEILSAKAPMIKGQNGGVATALLNYTLSENLVENVVIIDKSDSEAWKPEAIITNNTTDVIKAAGTKYAACNVFTPLKKLNNGNGRV
ncbi:MAG: Coenzyme F420 hydrogenase/dehydrogenase, beta subunit C-terminal domain [Methanobacterium sp.]|nr:Coenzyme F420 hydrogenase/dehydrogenase, beta subunit C-terminal domain [Methanobacterium sp.]